MPAYPQAPAERDNQAAERQVQPSSIHTAVRLMWAGAAISLVSVVVTLFSLGSLKSQTRDQLEKSGQQVTESTVNAAYSVAIVVAVVAGLIAVVLWLWMAQKNGQGRGWARIVATVLGVINLLFTVFGFTSGNSTTFANIVSVVNLLLAIAILVLLWRKESSDFYAAGARQAY